MAKLQLDDANEDLKEAQAGKGSDNDDDDDGDNDNDAGTIAHDASATKEKENTSVKENKTEEYARQLGLPSPLRC